MSLTQSQGDQFRVRHLQRVQELCAASIRTFSGDVSLLFRGQRLHNKDGPLPLYAPHLHPRIDRDDFVTFRGAADAYALRLTQSDGALHEGLKLTGTTNAVERLIFDLLEQFRVEAQVPTGYLGMHGNLKHCFEQWSIAYQGAGFIETVHGMMLFALAHICRTKVTGDQFDDDIAEKIESARAKIVQKIGPAFQGLKQERQNQASYLVHSLAIAKAFAQMLIATQDGQAEQIDQGESIELAAFALMDAKDSDEPLATAMAGASKVLTDAVGGYRVFTTQYDSQVNSIELVGAAQLAEFRVSLDARVAGLGVNVQRLARQLRSLLAMPARDSWEGGQEEGYLDGRRLSQLIASASETRIFKQERIQPHAECTVTFLFDCSGSMKTHIAPLAALLDLVVRALDMAEVECEVLGYTTGAWTGGRAQKDWLKAGKPPHPGRLNEAMHIVFKPAEVSWRRARLSIAALLKTEIFREGIDGEAILWAEKRLANRESVRKILVVVSDGSPMDSATNLANDEHYLDHHLRQVVSGIENKGAISIVGIGVGSDMSPYYRKNHVLDLVNSSANQSLREMIELITYA